MDGVTDTNPLISTPGEEKARLEVRSLLDLSYFLQMTYKILGHGLLPSIDLRQKRIPFNSHNISQLLPDHPKHHVIIQIDECFIVCASYKGPQQHSIFRSPMIELNSRPGGGHNLSLF